jgi:acid phosphatase (class A)
MSIFGLVISFLGTTTTQNTFSANRGNVANASDYTTGYLPASPRISFSDAPKKGSAKYKRDVRIAKRMKKYYGTTRWRVAATDEYIGFESRKNYTKTNCQTFDCLIGLKISYKNTPAIYKVLYKIFNDRLLVSKADKPLRKRPFVHYKNLKTCDLPLDSSYAPESSYPSGHTLIGMLTGLALAKIDPADSTKIMNRAYSYGISRLVCERHWFSDVEQSVLISKQIFNRIEQVPEFQQDVKVAQTELAQKKRSVNSIKKDYSPIIKIAKQYKKTHGGKVAKNFYKKLLPVKKINCKKENKAIKSVDTKYYEYFNKWLSS